MIIHSSLLYRTRLLLYHKAVGDLFKREVGESQEKISLLSEHSCGRVSQTFE